MKAPKRPEAADVILRVPGDKSITQRALILAALSDGTSRLSGLLPGSDPRATAEALRALGTEIPPLPDDGGEVVVRGRGLRGLIPPDRPLDLENSGTGARLLLGVLAGQDFESTVTGDASLRRRPMARITGPLSVMGAGFRELGESGRLPLTVRGGRLEPLEYETPVASAQIKSSLLLAGVTGSAFVLLTEPGRSRDHTERMLRAAGTSVITHSVSTGWRVELRDPPDRLAPVDIFVPGDVSSAAFFLVLGLLGGAGDELTVRNVGLNPTRTGILPVLERMGADLDIDGPGADDGVGEPVGTLTVRPGTLRSAEVGRDEIPGLIDEIPILAVAAARAEGLTRITGAEELRVKETDRLRALAENLRALGVEVEELDDGLEIRGTDRPLRGRVKSFGDHRMAMAFGVLGALPGNDVEVDGGEVVEVSFPTFWSELRRLSGAAEKGGGSTRAPEGVDPSGSPGRRVGGGEDGAREPVVTIDGPAGSGKSTTAREVARRLGYRHLDSGALYRALTRALFDAGIEPDRWSELDRAELDDLGVTVEADNGSFRILIGERELDEELRAPDVTEHVSELASLPEVRKWLLAAQREAGRGGGLVADGRDMGSVVFPDAEVKVFLTADLEERARRRLADHGVEDPDPNAVAREASRLRSRDRRDSEREHSPLRRADDAVALDTTDMDFEAQVQAVVELVRRRK